MAAEQQQLLSTLEAGWGTYVSRFRQLSPAEQKIFLTGQGYACLGDLLGHIDAWWERALNNLPALLAGEIAEPPPVDVDAFNARAVTGVQGLEPAEAIRRFEQQRSRLAAFIAALPDEAFERPALVHWLRMEVNGHLAEHEMAGKTGIS